MVNQNSLGNANEAQDRNDPIVAAQKKNSRWLVCGAVVGGFVCLVIVLGIIIGPQLLAGLYLARGDSNRQLGNLDQAIADYNKAIEFRPNFPEAYRGRGASYFYKGDYNHAIADASKAIELRPNFSGAYYDRGVSYRFKLDFNQAIADFDKAIQLQPNFPDAYRGRGESYYFKGDYTLALADFDQAIQLRPDFRDTYYLRADTYLAMQNYDQAILDYTKGIQLQPDLPWDYAPWAYVGRGMSYFAKGDYNHALADMDKAIQLDPNFQTAYFQRGLVYFAMKNYDQAIFDFTQSIQIYPDDSFAYFYRAQAYYQQGEYDLAILDYDKAIQLQPDNNPVVHYHRGLAHEANQDKDRAIADFQQVLILATDPALRQEAQEHLNSLESLELGDTLLSDDFSRADQWGTSTDSDSSIEYANQALQFIVFTTNYFVWSTPNDEDYSNIYIEVTALNNSTDSTTAFGIICNMQATDVSYYFAITSAGQYAIGMSAVAVDDVFLTNNDEWANSDLIPVNASSYLVGADCASDGRLTLYVNGQQIDSVTDTTYASGNVALMVWSGEEQASGADVSFDDFVMSELP